MNENGMIWR